MEPDPKFTRHLKDAFPTIESIAEANDAVAATVASPGWNLVLALLNAEIAEIDRQLDSGPLLESRAEYAHLHGRRGGLRGAKDAAHALMHRAETRLEEQRAKHERDAEPSPT